MNASLKPQVEALEDRKLMSAGVTCSISNPLDRNSFIQCAIPSKADRFNVFDQAHPEWGVKTFQYGGLHPWHISATEAPGQKVDIFVNDIKGELYELVWNPSTGDWQSWQDLHWQVRSFDTFFDAQGVHVVGIDADNQFNNQLWQANIDWTGNIQSWLNLGGSFQFQDVLAVADYQHNEQIFAIGTNETMWDLNEASLHWTEMDSGHRFVMFGSANDKAGGGGNWKNGVDRVFAKEDALNGFPGGRWLYKDQVQDGTWSLWQFNPDYAG
jgi:hypothetical protein